MTPDSDGPPGRPKAETSRLVVGALAEFGIKAYGATAAVSVALSDEEKVAGKVGDAVNVVPNLVERYEAVKYVVTHQQEIRTALDYVNQNTPPQAELQAEVDKSTDTLNKIGTTLDEVGQAREAIGDIGLSPRSVLRGAQEAFGHVNEAWDARPDAGALLELGDRAEKAAPYVAKVRVLTGEYVDDLLHVVDNFSSDELPATIFVMAAALGLAFVLGRAVGFWARRGRPGLIARTLQRWGAGVFRRWYVSNLPYALSPPLYDAARERLQRDIVADPQEALDPDAFRDLESWFAGRSDRTS